MNNKSQASGKQNKRVSDSSSIIQKPKKKTLQFNQSQNKMFRKKQWSQRQDKTLLKAIKEHGPKRWAFIATFVNHRIGKQCRERWHNHLNPKINKDEWSEEQQWLLFLMYSLQGGKWAKMTKILTQRTDNSIKNHWNSIMQKKIPVLQQKLSKVLKQKELIVQQQKKQKNIWKEKEDYLINKLKIKNGQIDNTDPSLLKSNSNNRFDFEESFQFMQESSSRNMRMAKKQSLESEKQEKVSKNNQNNEKIEDFDEQVNAKFPQTTEDLVLKQKNISSLYNKQSENQGAVESLQNLIDKYQQPLMLKKQQSYNYNYQEPIPKDSIPILKRKNSSFALFESKKNNSNFSLIGSNSLCDSPNVKAKYQEILPEDSEQYDDLLIKDLNEPTLLRKRSSRNKSMMSPSKFMQRESGYFR